MDKIGSAATGPFARSLRCEILDESTDSPAVSRLDLEQNDLPSLSKHIIHGLLRTSTNPCFEAEMLTLAGPCTYEEEIRKSRFIANAAPVSTPEETFAFLEKVSQAQATHNCWVFRIGTNYRFSEDGEPKGTVGKPMLGAIERLGLDHVMVVVTRYFGGIKLGAGGLTRAYGGVTATCLQNAEKKDVQPMADLEFVAAFDIIGAVYQIIKQFDADKKDEEYVDTGTVIRVRIEAARTDAFAQALMNASRGAIVLRRLD